MLKFGMLALMISSVYGVEMSVKKGDVLVDINAQEVQLKKGSIQELEEGTTVCFIEGKGKVIIPKLKKQLKKPGRCLMVPISQNSAVSYMRDIKNKANIAFWDSSESVRHGAGTKGSTEYDSKDVFVVRSNDEELLIYGKEFGPLPVFVIVKNKDGEEILTFENDESELTLVKIRKKYLKTGMYIEIYDGFETLLLKKSVVVEGL